LALLVAGGAFLAAVPELILWFSSTKPGGSFRRCDVKDGVELVQPPSR
jgi:hypothetical protein